MRSAQVSRNADHTHDLEHIESRINFPPANTLTGARHVAVMIVVPAFAESDERKKEIVPAVVTGFKSAGSPDVRQRIDRKCSVPQNNG